MVERCVRVATFHLASSSPGIRLQSAASSPTAVFVDRLRSDVQHLGDHCHA